MKMKKQGLAAQQQLWSVADLGALYTEHSFELKSHAIRILKDSVRADEVVQDAFIKVMLAAPELTSKDHALAYLHRTIETICVDLFRSEGRRPNLVVLDEVQSEIEAKWQSKENHDDVMVAAEDAAIIRQALALLSPAERTALVMWEMDGRSTSEIAKELGIKESSVRHTVSRARTSLRKVLSTLVIDEERGLTALDLLSKSYKKATEVAHKSSRAALSLILVAAAFLGFHTMTGSEPKTLLSNNSAPLTTELLIPVTSTKNLAVKGSNKLIKNINKPTNSKVEISLINNELEFAKAQLGAQIDLLNVIMDTNIFGTDLRSALPSQVTSLKAITNEGEI